MPIRMATADELGISNPPSAGQEQDKPPRAKITGTAKTAGNPPWAEIQKSLEAAYAMAGGALAFTPAIPDRVKPIGVALINNSESCTEAWIEAAKKNPALAKALTRMVTGGAYMGIIAAHMPILLAIVVAVNPSVVQPPSAGQPESEPEPNSTPFDNTFNPDFGMAGVG